MMKYNPGNWFWRVAGDESKYWSSARAAWVDAADLFFTAWRDAGNAPTSIGSLADLAAVLADAYPAGMPATYLPAKRYAVETGGITVNGASIATDRESQAMISGAFNFAIADPQASINYKTAAGFVTLTADQVKGLALAVGQHVQACFEKEATVAAQIAAGAVTTIAQIDAAFQTIGQSS